MGLRSIGERSEEVRKVGDKGKNGDFWGTFVSVVPWVYFRLGTLFRGKCPGGYPTRFGFIGISLFQG